MQIRVQSWKFSLTISTFSIWDIKASWWLFSRRYTHYVNLCKCQWCFFVVTTTGAGSSYLKANKERWSKDFSQFSGNWVGLNYTLWIEYSLLTDMVQLCKVFISKISSLLRTRSKKGLKPASARKLSRLVCFWSRHLKWSYVTTES